MRAGRISGGGLPQGIGNVASVRLTAGEHRSFMSDRGHRDDPRLGALRRLPRAQREQARPVAPEQPDTLTGLFALAGRADLADRVRPTARRRAGLTEAEDGSISNSSSSSSGG